MCGIAGIVDPRGRLPARHLAAMGERLQHRGPDDAGQFVDARGQVGLAHRRLAILDLSARGHQPMTTPDGRWTVVFNGEIYNYRELRRQLEATGLQFTTECDTEVLLRAYERWGPAAVDRFVGMFAFAIWDDVRQELFVARDRVGKKPLVYYWDGTVFAFASELKALGSLPPCRPLLDADAVDAYLALGYVPAPLSIFRNTFKLPAGHYLRHASGELTVRRYWFPEHAPAVPERSPAERLEAYRELIRDAVKIRLRADVPIGLFLSGGIDSSVIAAECVRQGHSVTALTVSFDDDDTDLPYARQVARHLGLPQEVIHARGDDVRQDLPQIVWHYDEPFADSSSVPSYVIARHTREHFKVVLNGDGGDEAFAGYPHYEFVGLKQWAKRFATLVGVKDGRITKPWQVYFQSKALFRQSCRADLLRALRPCRQGLTGLLDADPYLSSYAPHGALKMALWADRHIYLANDLLFKMDVALMAHGIEGRSPLLDHRLLEWAQGLPAAELVQGRAKKTFLRRAYREQLPAGVLDRRKHGFGSPIRRWLQGPFQELVREHIPCPLLDPKPQRRLLEQFARTGSGRWAMPVWTILMFSLWARQWNATW